MISSAKEHIIMVLQTTLYTSLKFSKCYGGEIPICELTSQLCAPGPWWLLLTVDCEDLGSRLSRSTADNQHNTTQHCWRKASAASTLQTSTSSILPV